MSTVVLYGLISVGSWVGMLLSLRRGAPKWALWFYMPISAVSFVLVLLVVSGSWRDWIVLDRLCAANLVVNLGTTTACAIALAG